ncbi:SDR family NAD(P)-dependent oxidoreductase, partial [Streptomyces galilaeus]
MNVSSVAGWVALPFMGPYCASKFALEAYSDALRLELRPWGVPVSVIEPGSIATPIWEKSIPQLENPAHFIPNADWREA